MSSPTVFRICHCLAPVCLLLAGALWTAPSLADTAERAPARVGVDSARAGGRPGPRAAPSRLRVDPPAVELTGPDARLGLIVTGHGADGRTLDLTGQSRVNSLDPRIVRTEGAILIPAGDGEAVVAVAAGGETVRVPVRVRATRTPREFSFVNDIGPILSKAGCNSGGCHGKASGQNGFKLTVFGYDPEFDHQALTQEGRGRRILPGDPARSLLLLKATLGAPHGGGRRFPVDSSEYRTLLRWIEAGAPMGRPDGPRLAGISVFPTERVLLPAGEQQVRVTATYTDGSRRDVTASADFSSNADHVATVRPDGLIQGAGAPGEAAVMVRYMGGVAATRVVIPRPGRPAPPERYAWLRSGNALDRRVAAKLQQLGIEPSAPADDATFLRRVSLDLIGTLPTPAEARAFSRECSAERQATIATRDPRRWRRSSVPSPPNAVRARAALVERLLARPEYAALWAIRWADVLRVDREALGPKGAYAFYRWLRDRMTENTPYSRWAGDLLVAQGSSAEVGPANLYRAARTPEELANTVSQVFLGVRLQCAQCHHHPFEKWTQEDFWGVAGFFTRLERQADPPDSERIATGGTEEARHPRTGAIIPARVLEAPIREGRDTPSKQGGLTLSSSQSPAPDTDRREELARWLTAPGNRFFARMFANRLWSHFLGRGVVEPVDDMRDTNPPSNGPLLDELTALVVRSGFDQKAVIREIVNSRVYQLSAVPNPTNLRDQQNFSRATVRRLPAEVLLDAISDATGLPAKFEGAPSGVRAIELWDNRLPSYFLEVFGRPLRGSPCECERSQEPSMSQALHLMNSPVIHDQISSRRGRVARLVRAGIPPAAMVEELYLAMLCRLPSADERRTALALFDKAENRQTAGEDLLWTLMNSFAFIFNR